MAPPDTTTALGIDIGGTRVRVGLVTADGEALARTDAPLPPGGEPDALTRLLADRAREVSRHAATPPAVAGVALPGVWDRATGVMQRAINLPELEGVNLPALLTGALDRLVHLETDVNAAMWAQWLRLDRRPARLVYLSLGTGVGGGVLLDGAIVRHTRGGGGHFGFLIVDTSPEAPVGENSLPGSLSAFVAGPALLRAVGDAEGDPTADEPLPLHVVARAARALAIGIAQLVHIYAPDAVALGGGVIDHHPELLAATRAAFSRYQTRLTPPALRLERAPLPTDEAGVIGAALLALRGEGS
ncbi:MAG: ROK family protein [Phycisphaerae bacterium]|jgi:glucokinase